MHEPARVVTRRTALRLAAGGGTAGLIGWAGHDTLSLGRPGGGGRETDLVTPETQATIDRGLAFLAQAQFADGGFSPDSAGGGAAVGIAALAGLALLAGGHHPGRGRYAPAVSRVVDYLLAAAAGPTSGLLAAEAQRSGPAGPGQHAMYSHGFACLCLSEASGTLPEPARQRRVQAVLEQAVGYTVRAQAADGGWRYVPHPPYSDVSVTVAQLMALRAARNAGVHVRKGVVDAGAGFVWSCQQPDGGFAYTRGPAAASAFARSAASLDGLFSAGVYAGSQLERGLRYVTQFLPVRQFSFREIPPHHYYYGHYYAALAMWTVGGEY